MPGIIFTTLFFNLQSIFLTTEDGRDVDPEANSPEKLALIFITVCCLAVGILDF